MIWFSISSGFGVLSKVSRGLRVSRTTSQPLASSTLRPRSASEEMVRSSRSYVALPAEPTLSVASLQGFAYALPPSSRDSDVRIGFSSFQTGLPKHELVLRGVVRCLYPSLFSLPPFLLYSPLWCTERGEPKFLLMARAHINSYHPNSEHPFSSSPTVPVGSRSTTSATGRRRS